MMRKPLGRGLDALIGTAAAGIEIGADIDNGGGAAERISGWRRSASITAGPFQPRINFDKERLAELTRAIQSQGIIEPLIVRRIAGASAAGEIDGPRYELIAGERRLRAARAAGLEAVPVVVRELDDRAALEMSLVENIVREDLERGRRRARVFPAGRAFRADPGRNCGASRQEPPLRQQRASIAGTAAADSEYDREGAAHGRTGAAAARDRIARGATVGGAADRGGRNLGARRRRDGHGASPAHRRKPHRDRSAADANLNALAEGLQRALKRKVRIFKRRGRSPGRIEIDYYDDNDLTAVAEMLLGAVGAGSKHQGRAPLSRG